MTYLEYPYNIDGRGRTAGTSLDRHIVNLIKQILFTSPGERVNRPDFGSAVMQLVFAPSGEELTTATQFLVQSALQQFLGNAVQVESVDVTADDATLSVTVAYVVRSDKQRRVATVTRETA